MLCLTALVGMEDAIGAEQADLAVVFGFALVLSLLLFVRSFTKRRSLTVRVDLARWMAERAAIGGEGIDAVADRVISAYRAGFVGDRGPEAEHGHAPEAAGDDRP